ncbi:MAG TPA: hypothetical protein VEL47_01020 [Myxococcota bacterium]|nr:hypothetical protein [Myxococcota bacterium]
MSTEPRDLRQFSNVTLLSKNFLGLNLDGKWFIGKPLLLDVLTMKSLALFICLFFFGLSTMATDTEKKRKSNEIIKLNMGGYRADISWQVLEQSGCDYFEALFRGDFKKEVDSDGRTFINCSYDVARVMHHFICHNEVADSDIEIARTAADFFICQKLKQICPENFEWKWLTFKFDSKDDFFLVDNSMATICPICRRLIKTEVDKFCDSQFDHAIGRIPAHMVLAHGGQINKLSCPRFGAKCEGIVQYRFEACQNQNESSDSAALVSLRSGYSSLISYSCPLKPCTFNHSYGCDNTDRLEVIKKHLAESHQGKTLYISDSAVLFTYPCREKHD